MSLLDGASHALVNEYASKTIDTKFFSPKPVAAAASPTSGSGAIVVPTVEESPSGQPNSDSPPIFPSSDSPPSVSPDGQGINNCNGDDCPQSVSLHRIGRQWILWEILALMCPFLLRNY